MLKQLGYYVHNYVESLGLTSRTNIGREVERNQEKDQERVKQAKKHEQTLRLLNIGQKK